MRKSRNFAYKRALFIRFGGIGDILLATPCVRALVNAFPGIEVDFIVGTGNGEVLEGNPNIHRVIEFDRNSHEANLRDYFLLMRDIARARYDLVINLHPSIKSFIMSAAATPRRLLIFRKNRNVQRTTGRVTHAVDDFLKEIVPLGVSQNQSRDMNFTVPDSARSRIKALLHSEGVEPTSCVVVMNPGANREVNRWPESNFAAVAAHFVRTPKTHVVVTGGAEWECDLARRICTACPEVVNLSGELSIKDLGALLERADSFLTSDTGPMHIGAALNTRMIVLSGAADPDRTGPLTSNAKILIDRSLSCVPCGDRICARGDIVCMQNLSINSVIESIERSLNGRFASELALNLQ